MTTTVDEHELSRERTETIEDHGAWSTAVKDALAAYPDGVLDHELGATYSFQGEALTVVSHDGLWELRFDHRPEVNVTGTLPEDFSVRVPKVLRLLANTARHALLSHNVVVRSHLASTAEVHKHLHQSVLLARAAIANQMQAS